MDSVAFILGDTFIYWRYLILALGACCGICLYLGFYLWESGNGLAAAVSVPVGLEAGILLARLVHWYCRPDSYESLSAAMTDLARGDFALMGVFAGVLLTAVLLRVTRISRNLPQMLDAMAIGGCAGIGVGRLAAMFTGADRGMVLSKLTSLPLAYPVTDPVTGDVQYRLATFYLQALACAGILLFLLAAHIPGRAGKWLPQGDTAWLFFSLYGASQGILDSTRYDSLFFRSNGFVSIVQILGAVSMVSALVYFSFRCCRRRGLRWWNFPLWLLAAGALGGAGYMEYFVQRHADQAGFAYRVMLLCLGVTVAVTLVFWLMGLLRTQPAPASSRECGTENA